MTERKKRKKRAPLTPERSLKNLSDIALFMSTHVDNVIDAAFITHVADAFFTKSPAGFRTNPANTLPYRALHALEERSIMEIGGILKNESKVFVTDLTIRRKGDVIRHREALAHPMLLEWQGDGLQEFIDADRQYLDFKAGAVWDMQKSINEHLAANSKPIFYEGLRVNYSMAYMLHGILTLASDGSRAVPDPGTLLAFLEKSVATFIKLLEQHPDGQVPQPAGRKTMKQRMDALRERWATRESDDSDE